MTSTVARQIVDEWWEKVKPSYNYCFWEEREELEAIIVARLAAAEARAGRLEAACAELVADERKFVIIYRTGVDDSIAYCNFCDASHQDEYQIRHGENCPVAKARAALADNDNEGV